MGYFNGKLSLQKLLTSYMPPNKDVVERLRRERLYLQNACGTIIIGNTDPTHYREQRPSL